MWGTAQRGLQGPATMPERESLPTTPPVQSAWLSGLTSLTRSLARLIPPSPFTPERWIKAAQRSTGLTDLGSEQFGDIVRPLSVWLDAVENEADLSPLGRRILRNEVKRALHARLKVIDALNKAPQILNEPIARPRFIVGLPRSGTTMLHRLLALDPTAHAPLFWELLRPAPPTNPSRDLRRYYARWQLAALLALVPDYRTVHPIYAEEPEECVVATTHCFLTMQLDARVRTPRYVSWLLQQDAIPVYRYHRAVLQLLQWKQPRRQWILKSPEHLFWLDSVLAVYPDAEIVQIHRDPMQITPSGCSLLMTTRRIFSERLHPEKLGEEWLSQWGSALERFTKARAALPRRQCFDVSYQDLITDPRGVLRSIRTHFGEEHTPEHDMEVTRWLKANPAERHGKHSYTLAEFGLTKAQVEARFSAYWERWSRRAG